MFAQLARLKAANPRLRILISIGGWTNSKFFSKVAATAAGRRRFANSIIHVFFRPFPRLFDGVDIDWEYPVSGGAEGNLRSPLDRENFPKLMEEVRRRLHQFSATKGHRYDLSIAVSADRDELGHLALAKLLQSVDWITVMAYDYYAGADVTGFNAPLFGTKDDPISGADVATRASEGSSRPAFHRSVSCWVYHSTAGHMARCQIRHSVCSRRRTLLALHLGAARTGSATRS